MKLVEKKARVILIVWQAEDGSMIHMSMNKNKVLAEEM